MRNRNGGGGLPLAVPILLGAILLGLIAGYLLGRAAPSTQNAAPDDPILWNEVQEARRAEQSPEDSQWAERASDDGEAVAAPAAAAGGRTAFGFCHEGGGTNCVVDGDTFYIGGAKVRIAGIDAPETHEPRCPREAELGAAATRRLQAMLSSGPVTMSAIDRDRDSYGRLLRNVAVGGRDVGQALIAAGVAREYGSGRRSWC